MARSGYDVQFPVMTNLYLFLPKMSICYILLPTQPGKNCTFQRLNMFVPNTVFMPDIERLVCTIKRPDSHKQTLVDVYVYVFMTMGACFKLRKGKKEGC